MEKIKKVLITETARFFGRCVAFVLLPLAGCVILFLAPFIKISSPGPVFFRQKRIGYKGKTITILKLRTFTNEADYKLRCVTAFGKAVRHTGLDEVPQILSIISGDMQWFGPRPHEKEEISVEHLQNYIDTVLSQTRPGIFGWCALRRGIGKYNFMTEQEIKADYEELIHRSVLNSLYLLFITAVTVFGACFKRPHKI